MSPQQRAQQTINQQWRAMTRDCGGVDPIEFIRRLARLAARETDEAKTIDEYEYARLLWDCVRDTDRHTLPQFGQALARQLRQTGTCQGWCLLIGEHRVYTADYRMVVYLDRQRAEAARQACGGRMILPCFAYPMIVKSYGPETGVFIN